MSEEPQLYRLRKHLEQFLEDEGYELGDTGFGMGQADLDVSFNGRTYSITISDVEAVEALKKELEERRV